MSVAELFSRYFSNASICRILLAAMDSFFKRGFHATSTRDIAKRAKLSPAAVYVHFRSKEELLFTVSIVAARWAFGRILAASERGGTPPERLRRLVSAHVSCHAALHSVMYVANYEFRALSPQQRRKVIDIREQIEALFADCLAEGCASGDFYVEDIRLTKIAIVSLCVSVLNWFSLRGRLTPESLGDRYADLVLAMVTRLNLGQDPRIAKSGSRPGILARASPAPPPSPRGTPDRRTT